MKKVPHTFIIIFGILVFCAILTWIIPAGEFQRTQVEVEGVTRNVIVNDSFRYVEAQPQSWQVFSALLDGFQKQSGIIAFILIIGAAFQMLNSSKAIDIGILSFLHMTSRLEKYSLMRKLGVHNLVLILIMIMFSLFGGIFGMSEETLAFVIILVPLAIYMGYDSIVGVSLVYVAAHVGFSGAMLNPFTIGIAQGLSGLPLFSGIEFRIVVWLILTTFMIVWVLWYANRVRKNPASSVMYESDAYWRQRERDAEEDEVVYRSPVSMWITYGLILASLIAFSVQHPITTYHIGENNVSFVTLPVLAVLFAVLGFVAGRKSYHFFNLVLLLYTILFLIIGVLGYQWYLAEISALFLAMGIASTLAMGQTGSQMVKEFSTGAKDILTAAMVVGLAGGIIEILTNGKILDTMLYSTANLMEEAGKVTSLYVMYAIQTGINLFIPSGSAKAALTMPIMAPFSDVIGISRQATVMAYQFGDGFTNMITPTSGVLIGALGIARIPYEVWLKWVLKFIIALIVIGALLLLPTLFMDLPGF